MSPLGDVLADGLDAGLVLRPAQAGVEPQARLDGRVRRGRRGRCDRSRRRVHQAGVDVVEPAGQPATVAIERPPAQPGEAGPAIPGDDPVVEREPERRQVLVRRRRSPAGARTRRPGRTRGTRRARRGTAAHRPARPASRPADSPARARPRTGPARRRRLQDRDRVGGQVAPARVAPGPRALEQRQPGRSRNASAASIGRVAATRSGRRRSRSVADVSRGFGLGITDG